MTRNPADAAEGAPVDPSGPGSVVLDIGAGFGSLVVSTPEALCGEEIEIRRIGEPWCGEHTAVRERRLGARTAHAGVFPRLEPGGYELRMLGSSAPGVHQAHVRAGEVAETWMCAPQP